MKLKRKVDVPESQIKKTVFQQKGSAGGGQRRYAVTAEQDGVRMFKFISEATYKSMQVPEVN